MPPSGQNNDSLTYAAQKNGGMADHRLISHTAESRVGVRLGDVVLQSLARGELGDALGSDLNCGAGLGIAARASLAM